MPITINGSGTVTGISVGGLPDGIVDTDMLANNAVNDAKSSLTTGKVLQVVSTTKNDSASHEVADGGVSGDVLTADITPASSSNKVLIILSIYIGSADHGVYATIYRGGSVITNATGDASGVRQRVSAASFVYNDNRATELNKTYLDSPSTTSSTTYSVRIGGSYTSTGTYYINHSYQNANENESARGMSTLTLMEIAA